MHSQPVCFAGKNIFRVTGGFNFSASGGCRFAGGLKLQTVSFAPDTVSQEY
jgi:hypothetical protein